ncbi:MAG: chemotaxis protein CheW [Paracoccaceae bacterium]|jgi:purine-binding chemotaxis protein CheW|nr:chemotaxis protein CheW [Paracoccaceae bacterium]
MSLAPLSADPDAPGDAPDGPAPLTLLTFVLGGQVFAVPVTHVREIVDRSEISALPNAPHDVLGLIDLRGQSVPVVDLAARLGIRAEPGAEARVVVFAFSGEGEGGAAATSLGVLTERVLRVAEIGLDALEPMPDTLSGWRCEAATTLARTEDGRALVLDVDGLLRRGRRPGPFDFD